MQQIMLLQRISPNQPTRTAQPLFPHNCNLIQREFRPSNLQTHPRHRQRNQHPVIQLLQLHPQIYDDQVVSAGNEIDCSMITSSL